MAAVRSQVIALVLLVFMTCFWMSQSRYLPTRSDGSRREQIKELLRAILELPQDDRDMPRPSYSYEYHPGGSSIAKRSIREAREQPLVYPTEAE